MSRRLSMSVVLSTALAVLATCDSIDNFQVEAKGQAVIAQGTIIDELLGTLSFAGFDGFDISQSQQFRNQGYTKDQVDSVRMERFTLTIVSPQTANFDFIDSIRFYAEAAGLPRVLIAEMPTVPDGSTALELTVDQGVELQPYVIAPTMTITTEATGVRPPQETTIEANAVFDVDVNVTGSCS